MTGTSSRAERLEELLDSAFALPQEQRQSFVTGDGVEPELRQELAELLEAAEGLSLLDDAPEGRDSAAIELFGPEALPSAVNAGQRIGHYKLLRMLGEGGMASVWLGERDDGGFAHQVAIKCLKTGLATPERLARFLREQQILAKLQHPNIARLYDAGLSSDGVPFIVMEWVDGASLTRFCDDHRLGIAARLQLFLKVCSAVAYAHQNLIVHRDLKPANILVGADGEPKLLDFGIAKLLRDDSDPLTRSGVHLLTPEYAAPEQYGNAVVTTVTDVHGLGAVLYEMLCGQRPRKFPGHRRAVEVEVTMPSEAVRRLSTADLQATDAPDVQQLASARSSTPDRWRQTLRGDLDTIVMTALQAEPIRRYPTVQGFGDDIERYLQQRPIHARKDSFNYWLGRFLRRNALAVSMASLMLLALIGALLVSVRQERIADRERQRAEQRFEDVRGLAHAMLFDLHDQLAKLPGSTAARSALVKQAVVYLQRLGDQGDAPAALRLELAEAWLRVGDVQGGLKTTNLGDVRGALSSYAQAAAHVDSVLRENPGDDRARILQAQILKRRGDALYDAREMTDAYAAYRGDIDLWMRLLREHVHDAGFGLATAQTGLAGVFATDGKLPQALQEYSIAQATLETAGPGDEPKDYALVLGTIEVYRGGVLDWQGRHVEALALLQHGQDRLQAAQKAWPDDPRLLYQVAWSSMRLGDVMYDSPDKKPMLAAYETAQAAFAKLVAEDPGDMHAKRTLALCEKLIGDTLVMLKQYDEAMKSYLSAQLADQQLLADHPNDGTTRQQLADTWYGIASLYQASRQSGQSVTAFQQTLALYEALLKQHPSGALRRDVAQVFADLAAELPPGPEACRDWIASAAAWRAVAAGSEIALDDQSTVASVQKHVVACR